MRQLGAAGRKKQTDAYKRGRADIAAAVTLQSSHDLMSALERALSGVEGSSADAVNRAKAVASLISAANGVLRLGELAAENERLKFELSALRGGQGVQVIQLDWARGSLPSTTAQ